MEKKVLRLVTIKVCNGCNKEIDEDEHFVTIDGKAHYHNYQKDDTETCYHKYLREIKIP